MNLHIKRKRDIMKGKKLLVTLAASAILFTGCGLKSGNAIIKVNDRKITQGQFDEKMDQAMHNSMFAQMGVDLNNGKNAFIINLMKVRIINELIVKSLLDGEIEKRGIKVTAKDTEDAIKDIIQKVGSKEQLDTILKQNGISSSDFKKDVTEQVKIKKLAESLGEVKVSDADAKKFYNENISRFKHPEQVKASHILVAANKADLAEIIKAENEGKELSEAELNAKVEERIKEKRAKAEEILAEVKKDPSKFAKIAKEKSEDPGTAVNGGELGFFPKGKMVPEFEKAAFALKPNSISDIVTTPYGYHIIFVTDRKEAGQEPFEKVQNDIKDYITNQKQVEMVDDLVESLKKNATIEYVDEAYNPDKVQGEIQKMFNAPQEQNQGNQTEKSDKKVKDIQKK